LWWSDAPSNAAFKPLLRLERACEVQVMALSCNNKIIMPRPEIMEKDHSTSAAPRRQAES